MQLVTDLADQAVVLPAAVAVALAFGALRWWRGLFGWSVAVAGTLIVMLLLKIGGVLVANAQGGIPVSASGHTACAGMLYGGIAALLLRRLLPGVLLALLPVAAALLIGYTRVQLHAHSLTEVMIGGLCGCLGARSFLALAGPPPTLAAGSAVAMSVAAALAFHGVHLPVERAIRDAFLDR